MDQDDYAMDEATLHWDGQFFQQWEMNAKDNDNRITGKYYNINEAL